MLRGVESRSIVVAALSGLDNEVCLEGSLYLA